LNYLYFVINLCLRVLLDEDNAFLGIDLFGDDNLCLFSLLNWFIDTSGDLVWLALCPWYFFLCWLYFYFINEYFSKIIRPSQIGIFLKKETSSFSCCFFKSIGGFQNLTFSDSWNQHKTYSRSIFILSLI